MLYPQPTGRMAPPNFWWLVALQTSISDKRHLRLLEEWGQIGNIKGLSSVRVKIYDSHLSDTKGDTLVVNGVLVILGGAARLNSTNDRYIWSPTCATVVSP